MKTQAENMVIGMWHDFFREIKSAIADTCILSEDATIACASIAAKLVAATIESRKE